MDRVSASQAVNQASQTDGASLSLQQPRATTYRYDDLNRLIEVSYPNGTRTTYTYDAAGNLTQTVTTNPLPALTSLNPNQAPAGGSAFTLTVNGTNFVSGAVVRWNGSDRPTTFVNDKQLTAAIPASSLAAAGIANVTVFNPAPDGGLSNALNFTVMRVVRVVDANGTTGSQVNVAVELMAQGNENALGFSLSFDPAVLSNPTVAPGSGAAGAALNLNLSQIAQGRLGLGLALPAGQMFAAGTQ
jgi:YD repeat-containing protein